MSPINLDDALEVCAEIQFQGHVRRQYGQVVSHRGEPLCEARVDIACVDAQCLRAVAWPPALAGALVRHPYA